MFKSKVRSIKHVFKKHKMILLSVSVLVVIVIAGTAGYLIRTTNSVTEQELPPTTIEYKNEDVTLPETD